MPSIFNRRFSIFHMVVFAAVTSIITFGVLSLLNRHNDAESDKLANTIYCNYNVKRITGLKFVKPILWVDEDCESDNLAAIKQKVSDIIEKHKQYGGVTDASMFLRMSGKWTIVNEKAKYEPGSLFKVPVMITILKMDEDNPGFLNKVVKYEIPFTESKDVHYASKSIQLGKSYTIKELLTYMIKYSDNAATVLLEKNMDSKVIQKLFSDLGVEVPNIYAKQYLFTVRDYSLFMRTIFNAGYLSIAKSEFAAELLSECDFNDGIVKGLPANTKIAHKFGEAGNRAEKQLHESAAVYLPDGKGYLLTVMTKGKDIKRLSELLAEISKAVYTDVETNLN